MGHVSDTLGLKTIISGIIPDHVIAENPDLVEFMQAYLDFLELENKAGFYQNTIDLQRDVDHLQPEFLPLIHTEIAAAVPGKFRADPAILYKDLSNQYRSSGTPQSITNFFNILYGDSVELYFPWDDVLIPSDGKWNDFKEATIAAPTEEATVLYTYTVATASDIVSGNDDAGNKLEFDNVLVFVNDIYRTDYEPITVINNTTNTLDYSLKFAAPLSVNDVVKTRRIGSYSTDDGFLSHKKFIQNSYLYQKFSYVLKTGQNADKWKNAFNRLIHPAGFKFFGEILLYIEALQQNTPKVQPGYQFGGLPIPIIIPVISFASRFVKAMPVGTLASYYTKSFKPQLSTEIFGPEEWFDNIKFDLSAKVGGFLDYTFEDVINKSIDVNMDCVVEISN
tara:strand:+ start:1087 stop:2265 length:1179 start_codon:yes stop_codon:yes gene_type:complete